MKLLVLSDSHKNIDHMLYVADKTQPDVILHLGDHIGDAQKLRRHIHGVRNGLHALITCAHELGANLALYGHTHIAMSRQASRLWLMCPGQMERHDDKRTAFYGIVTIAGGKFECVIEKLTNSPFEPVPI